MFLRGLTSAIQGHSIRTKFERVAESTAWPELHTMNDSSPAASCTCTVWVCWPTPWTRSGHLASWWPTCADPGHMFVDAGSLT